METYVEQMKHQTYNIETKRTYSKKSGTQFNKYCNDILVFDIEVTSAWLENGKIVGYKKGYDNDYWNSLTPLALPYLWQFSFNDKVYYGRELREFEKVLSDLPDDCEIIIWVHNLSYEMHFLNNFLEWENVFARTAHKPIKCRPKKYKNIEFRCSYMLTRLSLESWGKQIGWHKDVGYLDYETIRTPYTELTEKELLYGEDDCLVVYHGIQEYVKRYGNVRDIPLTQTGTVRRVVKEMLTEDKNYVKFLKKLIPRSASEYKMLMRVFSGGYTHANRFYVETVVRGYIEHYDFASSYPTVMICEKYPMTPWMYSFNKELPTDGEMENTAYILKLHFKNINCKTLNTYIQASKCEGGNFVYDNGRIIKADDLIIVVTEQDWKTIRDSYEWDECIVEGKYYSKKKYLPKKFIEYILELYHNKTTLKDIPEMEDLYMQSKQYINSMFGMCVTAIVQPEIEFDGTDWYMQPLTEAKVNERLDKLRNWKPSERRYFLSYSWGCWVTAYARRNLWKCILDSDAQCIYCDTDSIFVNGKHDFSWYNKEINDKIYKASQEVGFDFQKTRPKTKKGKEKPLGIFTQEAPCCEFVTLGAKRYVERRFYVETDSEQDGKLHLTVSGINKEAVALLDDKIENFVDGFDFDKDDDSVKKRLSTYLVGMPEITYDDGYHSTYTEGINMRRIGYLLTMTDEYKGIIMMSKMTINDLSEQAKIKLKGNFSVESEVI